MAIKVEYAVHESVMNIRRNLFITMAAILVVAVSLALFGGALLVGQAIGRTTALWTGNVRVTVFLSDNPPLSPDEKDTLDRELHAMPEVASVRFESKEQAYENFKRLFKGQPELVANASAQALPESFRVELKDPRQFSIIRDRLEGRPGIQVQDQHQILKRIFSFADLLHKLALWLALVVLVAALLLIATTIRMAIYARRKEIGIMKLVGATNWFIRIPFMVEGMVQGILGAFVAVGLLVLAKPFVFSDLAQQTALRIGVRYADIAAFGLVLLAVGVGVGALGSVLGLRRFLEV